MPSPRPEPTAIKKLKGNPGRRPLNDLEPQPKVGAPPMPTGLSRYAKQAWKRMVPILLDMGVLTVADGDALMLYCEAYAAWKQAGIDVKKNGTYLKGKGSRNQDILIDNPSVVERDKAHAQMVKLLAEFGCTPSSRSRLKVEKPKETDPFDEFLSGNSSAAGAGLRN